jgi:hypothetical protein
MAYSALGYSRAQRVMVINPAYASPEGTSAYSMAGQTRDNCYGEPWYMKGWLEGLLGISGCSGNRFPLTTMT